MAQLSLVTSAPINRYDLGLALKVLETEVTLPLKFFAMSSQLRLVSTG
jgi:hypothetical protein